MLPVKILFRTSRLHLNQDLDGNISGGLRVAVLHCAVGLLVADGTGPIKCSCPGVLRMSVVVPNPDEGTGSIQDLAKRREPLSARIIVDWIYLFIL